MRASGWAIVVLVIISSQPARASAQSTRAWEIAGGYQTVDDPLDRVTLLGWTADAAVRLMPWLSAVGETGAARRTIFEIELRQLALLGGARAAARIGPFTEFVQILAGVSRSGSTVLGESRDEGSAFALQPGGGVDVSLGDAFAARFQIDRRSLLGGEFVSDDRHEIRLAAVLVFHSRR
ncbi:MAG TPA: hypothetical protein VKH42_13805 [Vicinamibacterales bacterium]|nr:hypothetical protein [Vicinamibacterales bacterium]